MTDQTFLKKSVSEDKRRQGRIQFIVKGSWLASIIVSVFLPLLWFRQLYAGDYTSLSELVLLLLLNITEMLFLFLIVPYHISSMYLRYAVLLAFLVGVVVSLTRMSGLPFWPVHFATNWLSSLLTFVFVGYFASFSVRALYGYMYREPTLHLPFPLRSGCYAVGHGGSSKMINYHAANTAQHYANDILKLNRWGTRARGIYPRQLDAYYIFGDIVYSPCDGLIVSALDGLADLVPSEMDPTHAAGNHVIIMYQDRKILLAHLQQNSVLVRAGQQVREGQPIGKVGNSGNTSEPHLHIHAEYGGSSDRFGDGVGVPILFTEKGFLKRNDILIIRDKFQRE
ncbi:MAG: M23 family metallopeptidase [Ktedonobacteraceae bacterium]|nr:M23 family metallopeptidase [Ktedonobacteraceae bacterium]